MKSLLAGIAAITMLISMAPAFAAENDPNASTGKPGSSSNPTPSGHSDANPPPSTESTAGPSAAAPGTSREMPGASDSAKPDSSLSTNGNKPKQ
jgi:hypothetical protein